MISKKIVLTGSFGVGKTSLFNQFLYQKFSENHRTTVGVKVDKKSIDVDGKKLSLLIWDIAGEVAQEKVPQSYYLGSSAIIYVFDLTRPSTLLNLDSDIAYLKNLLKGVMIKIIGNKADLLLPDQIDYIQKELSHPYDILTSAKTGENVEELFQSIAKVLMSEAVK